MMRVLLHMVRGREYAQEREQHKAESNILHRAPVSTKSMVTATPAKYTAYTQ